MVEPTVRKGDGLIVTAGRVLHLAEPGASNTICGAYPSYYGPEHVVPADTVFSSEKIARMNRCGNCRKRVRRWPGTPVLSGNELVALLREAVAVIEGLADQQAMADDWYVEPLERFRSAATE